jgi:hypothetical protein
VCITFLEQDIDCYLFIVLIQYIQVCVPDNTFVLGLHNYSEVGQLSHVFMNNTES